MPLFFEQSFLVLAAGGCFDEKKPLKKGLSDDKPVRPCSQDAQSNSNLKNKFYFNRRIQREDMDAHGSPSMSAGFAENVIDEI